MGWHLLRKAIVVPSIIPLNIQLFFKSVSAETKTYGKLKLGREKKKTGVLNLANI